MVDTPSVTRADIQAALRAARANGSAQCGPFTVRANRAYTPGRRRPLSSWVYNVDNERGEYVTCAPTVEGATVAILLALAKAST